MFFGTQKKRLIPLEMQQQYGRDVIVDITNREAEDYKPPPLKPFSGQGQKLGAIPQVVPVISTVQSTGNPSGDKVVVDESKPTTTIQIRLADGTRLVAKFNLTHKVKDIRAHINSYFFFVFGLE